MAGADAAAVAAAAATYVRVGGWCGGGWAEAGCVNLEGCGGLVWGTGGRGEVVAAVGSNPPARAASSAAGRLHNLDNFEPRCRGGVQPLERPSQRHCPHFQSLLLLLLLIIDQALEELAGRASGWPGGAQPAGPQAGLAASGGLLPGVGGPTVPAAYERP